MTAKEPKEHDRAELIRVIADRSLVLALLVAGVVLAVIGDREHAGLLLAGALGAVAPLASVRSPGAMTRALPLALGIGGALALSGCGTTTGAAILPTLRTAARISCEVVSRAEQACEVAGLAPRREDSCPRAAEPDDDAAP